MAALFFKSIDKKNNLYKKIPYYFVSSYLNYKRESNSKQRILFQNIIATLLNSKAVRNFHRTNDTRSHRNTASLLVPSIFEYLATIQAFLIRRNSIPSHDIEYVLMDKPHQRSVKDAFNERRHRLFFQHCLYSS